MLPRDHQSTEALTRLALRLAIVLSFAMSWPGKAPTRAAGVLCFVLAAGSIAMARAPGEKAKGPGLNRWHEGALLVGLGLVLFFGFG